MLFFQCLYTPLHLLNSEFIIVSSKNNNTDGIESVRRAHQENVSLIPLKLTLCILARRCVFLQLPGDNCSTASLLAALNATSVTAPPIGPDERRATASDWTMERTSEVGAEQEVPSP